MKLTKDEVRQTFEDVRQNMHTLNECPGHQFDPKKDYVFGGKMTCTVCGGRMSNMDIAVYAKGFKAAGGDPNLVWPGIFDKGPKLN